VALGGLVTLAAGAWDGSASGSLTVNGDTAALRYAYASAQKGFFDKNTEDIRILLSDVELTEPVRNDTFALARLARAGTLHAVEVIVDASGEPLTGTIFVNAFNGMLSVSGVHRFANDALTRTRVACRLSMDAPGSLDRVTYRYEATFAAAIPRSPTAGELLAQQNSPPGRAAAAYLTALRQPDPLVLATLLTPADAAQYRGADGAQRFERLCAETPVDSHVIGVTLAAPASAARAEVLINGTRDGIVIEFTLTLVLQDGAWKVSGG
jgi:hypothetical protein